MPRSPENRQKGLRVALAAAALLVVPSLASANKELVVIEDPHCAPCQLFERQVGMRYPLTDPARTYPIRRLPLQGYQDAGLHTAAPIRRAPTFLIVDDQVEQHRFEGYTSDELFWMTLETLIAP